MDFETRLKSFVAGCQKIIDDQFEANYSNLVPPKLSIDPKGKKFTRIVRKNDSDHYGAVFCFVDKTNGDVLKAATWKAPAKHARGNIFADDNGLSNIRWTGPAYLN